MSALRARMHQRHAYIPETQNAPVNEALRENVRRPADADQPMIPEIPTATSAGQTLLVGAKVFSYSARTTTRTANFIALLNQLSLMHEIVLLTVGR